MRWRPPTCPACLLVKAANALPIGRLLELHASFVDIDRYHIDRHLYVEEDAVTVETHAPFIAVLCRSSRCLSTRLRSQMVDAFKALADATRLEIFRFIVVQEAPICARAEGVVDRFSWRLQPTISHHLKVLREAGRVRFRAAAFSGPLRGRSTGNRALAELADQSRAGGARGRQLIGFCVQGDRLSSIRRNERIG